jgi:hypothetical protein
MLQGSQVVRDLTWSRGNPSSAGAFEPAFFVPLRPTAFGCSNLKAHTECHVHS